MDQALTYILSAVGILGFYLAGKKVWWAWYVNIANQLIWLFFSVITQQWGFLLATAFYFVVFSKNAYHWTKEHNETKAEKTPDQMFIKARHFGMRWGYMKSPINNNDPELAQQPVSKRIAPKIRPASDIPKPPGSEHFQVDEETLNSYMRIDGTDPVVSNEVSFVISDVMRANGKDYVKFSERYGIAHEVQRRLDVKLKGTRPDVKEDIQLAIDSIDRSTSVVLVTGGVEYFEVPRIEKHLGVAKKILQKLLKGEPHVDKTRSSASPRNTDRDGVGNDI